MNKLLRATRITVQVLVAALLTAALIDYWYGHAGNCPLAGAYPDRTCRPGPVGRSAAGLAGGDSGVRAHILFDGVSDGRVSGSGVPYRSYRPSTFLPVFPALQPHEAYIARCVCGLAHSRCVGTGVADRSL